MERIPVVAAGVVHPGHGGVDESRSLTGLRALAALLVMVHHCYLVLGIDQHLPMVQWLLRKGYLGVDLFFVLSGFVLSMVYGPWFDGSRAVGAAAWACSLGRFLSRRVARLWPVHATLLGVVVALDLLLQHPLGAGPTPRLVAANVAMIQAWGVSAELNPPAWSVSTEFMAYLLFPLLTAVAARGRWGSVVCAALVVGALAACMAYAPPLGAARRGLLDIYFNYSMLPLLRCLAGFTVGILAWKAGQLPRVRALASGPVLGTGALLLFIAAMLGRVNDVVTLGLLPLLVLGMHHGRGPVHRLLATNPLHGLGVLSYAVYLVHVVVLRLFPFDRAPLPLGLAGYFAVTLACAGALNVAVERPGRRLIRGWSEAVLSLLFPGGRRRPPLQDGSP